MIQSSSDGSNAAARARTERLLAGADDTVALRHRLALIDIEAQHRLTQHRSHYNPGQPRVPAGNPDGGQWTDTGSSKIGIRVAADDTPRLPRQPLIALLVELVKLAKLAIEAYRNKEALEDLFGQKEGVVARATLDGKEVFGVNSGSKAYTSADRVAAERLRDSLRRKYPKIPSGENVGRAPWNALFHAETTALLRAARENGGTLAGKALTVYSVEMKVCPNCKSILPYVGLELGNPTVTFIESDGSMMTMQDGRWAK
jgi:hypothetical protein